MKKILPRPKIVDVVIPKGVDSEMYQAGFEHSVTGGQITKREHLKASFRLGFRNGRLYLKELRKKKGILEFPIKWKFNWNGSIIK